MNIKRLTKQSLLESVNEIINEVDSRFTNQYKPRGDYSFEYELDYVEYPGMENAEDDEEWNGDIPVEVYYNYEPGDDGDYYTAPSSDSLDIVDFDWDYENFTEDQNIKMLNYLESGALYDTLEDYAYKNIEDMRNYYEDDYDPSDRY